MKPVKLQLFLMNPQPTIAFRHIFSCDITRRTSLLVAYSLVVTLCLIYSGHSHARDFIVSQKNLEFSTGLKVINPGDRITFTNDDTVTHNVISQTNGFQFDLGAFKPGMKKTVSFDDLGVVDIECTVHPNMKLTVFIF